MKTTALFVLVQLLAVGSSVALAIGVTVADDQPASLSPNGAQLPMARFMTVAGVPPSEAPPGHIATEVQLDIRLTSQQYKSDGTKWEFAADHKHNCWLAAALTVCDYLKPLSSGERRDMDSIWEKKFHKAPPTGDDQMRSALEGISPDEKKFSGIYNAAVSYNYSDEKLRAAIAESLFHHWPVLGSVGHKGQISNAAMFHEVVIGGLREVEVEVDGKKHKEPQLLVFDPWNYHPKDTDAEFSTGGKWVPAETGKTLRLRATKLPLLSVNLPRETYRKVDSRTHYAKK